MNQVKQKRRSTKKSSKKASQDETSSGTDLSRKQSLIQSAKRLFAKKGLSGTSIRDIAQEAQVNSSLISYYFEGKEGLYRECLKEIGEVRLSFTKEILQPPKTASEFELRLKMFAENLFSLFLEDREAGLIIIREYDRIHSPAEDVFKDTFLKIFDTIVNFFKNAQTKNIIPKQKDPFLLASLFFGALSSQMRLDHIKEKTYSRTLKSPKERQKLLTHLVGLFIP